MLSSTLRLVAVLRPCSHLLAHCVGLEVAIAGLRCRWAQRQASIMATTRLWYCAIDCEPCRKTTRSSSVPGNVSTISCMIRRKSLNELTLNCMYCWVSRMCIGNMRDISSLVNCSMVMSCSWSMPPMDPNRPYISWSLTINSMGTSTASTDSALIARSLSLRSFLFSLDREPSLIAEASAASGSTCAIGGTGGGPPPPRDQMGLELSA